MPTLDEIDEALDHCQRIPQAERGDGWHAYVNALLEQRRLIPGHERRILYSPETR